MTRKILHVYLLSSIDKPFSMINYYCLIYILVDGKSNRERLIIGHNVSYDRQRCAEQYNILPSKTRFMDTMSLHIAVSGMTSGQRTVKAMFSGDTDVVSSEHNDSEISRP